MIPVIRGSGRMVGSPIDARSTPQALPLQARRFSAHLTPMGGCITDSFNRPDGTPGTSDAGPVWDTFAGPAVISSGRLAMVPRVVGLSVADLNMGSLPLPISMTFEFEATGDLLYHGTGGSHVLLDNAVIHWSSPPVAPADTIMVAYNAAFAQTNVPFVTVPGVVYMYRVHLLPATIKLKVWVLGDPEPSTWLIVHHDPIGFLSGRSTYFQAGVSQTSDTYYLDNLAIGCE